MRLFCRGEAASTLDLLVAGLGNPGPRHERDRHNVGWMVVDELARRKDVSFRSKFSGRLGEVRMDDRRHVCESQHVADLHVRYVDLDVLGHVGRQRLDVNLADDE